MAQLSDDCFAFGGRLMPLEDAWALMGERVSPVAGTETVPLDAADNRVLARDVVAPIPLPPFDNSAVDGYAVRHADLAEGPSVMTVTGRLAAGGTAAEVATGTALRIFTGAPMPEGLDTVFMQEDVESRPDGTVLLPAGLKRGANRRLAGEDIQAGAVALQAGRRLTPQDVALAAALGLDGLEVRRRLRIGILSTGDEVARSGGALPPGRLHDANRPMLAALARRLGCETSDLGILPDDPHAVTEAIAAAAAKVDLIVSSGGVSTGEEDHVKAAVEAAAGAPLTFWRIAIKPGRPVAMGVVEGAAFIGLPGNPVAAFVTFARVARALIARLSGEAWRPPVPLPVRSGFTYRKKAGRREYVRVTLTVDPEGRASVEKFPREGAGIVTSLTGTDGLVELPEDVLAVAPGDVLGFLPYASLL